MDKEAILFPGTGYTTKELLFVDFKNLLENNGYSVFPLDYSPIPFKPIETIKEAVDIALGYSICALHERNLQEKDELLFVEKSIGCISGLKLSSLLKLKSKHILLTPTKEALSEISEYSDILAMVIGDKDPLMDHKYLEDFCASHKIPILIIKNTGHSLKADSPKVTEEYNTSIIDFINQIL